MVVWKFLQQCIRHKTSVSVNRLLITAVQKTRLLRIYSKKGKTKSSPTFLQQRKEWKCTSRHCKVYQNTSSHCIWYLFRGQCFVTAISIFFPPTVNIKCNDKVRGSINKNKSQSQTFSCFTAGDFCYTCNLPCSE